METLFLLMFIVFWGYVSLVVANYGILPSLSDSYYHLPVKYRDIIFTSVFFFTGLCATILGQSGLMFGAGFGICLVGAAPQFHDSFVKPIHIIGAMSAAIFSQLFIYFNTSYWWINIAFLCSTLLCVLICKLTKSKNRIWWLEMLCFVCSFLALGLIYF